MKQGANKHVDKFCLNEIYQALLDLGQDHLKQGGRLVYLFHSENDSQQVETQFVECDGYRFVDSSENEIAKNRVRHCVTLERL